MHNANYKLAKKTSWTTVGTLARTPEISTETFRVKSSPNGSVFVGVTTSNTLVVGAKGSAFTTWPNSRHVVTLR